MGKSILTNNYDNDYNSLLNKPPFKTINNNQLIGEGNISIEPGKFYGIDTNNILASGMLPSSSGSLTITDDGYLLLMPTTSAEEIYLNNVKIEYLNSDRPYGLLPVKKNDKVRSGNTVNRSTYILYGLK